MKRIATNTPGAGAKTRRPLLGDGFSVGGLGEQLLLFGALGPAAFGIVAYGFLSRPGRGALARVAALAAAMLGVVGLVSVATDTGATLGRFALSTAMLLMAVAVDAWRRSGGRHVLLHLTNALIFSLAAYFTAMSLAPEYFDERWLELAPTAPAAFDVLLFGQLAVNVSYVVVWPMLLPLRQVFSRVFTAARSPFVVPDEIKEREEFVLLLALLAFGSISRVWNFAHGVYLYTQGTALPGTASSLLGQFERLYYLGWLFGLVRVFSGRRAVRSRTGMLSIGLAMAELAYQLLSGSKGRFFYYVIQPVSLVFLLSRRKVSTVVVGSFFVVALFSWLVVYPMLTSYRSEVAAASPQGISQAAQTLAAQSSHSRSDDTYLDNVLTPIRKSNKAEFVLALTSITHFHPTAQPADFWKRLLFFWVPRFLWPEKPASLDANRIGRLTARVTEDDATTSVVLTGPGELYVYYGYWGALLLGLGALVLRSAESVFSPFARSSHFRIAAFATFIDAATGWMAGQFEASVTGFLLQMGVMFAVVALARLVVSGSQARRTITRSTSGVRQTLHPPPQARARI